MKRHLLTLVILFATASAAWAQKLDLNQVIDLEHHHWTDKISGRLSPAVEIDDLIGNPSPELLAIDSAIDDFLHHKEMTQVDFNHFEQILLEYGLAHHNEIPQCNILLGNLYRFARPVELRDINQAEEYYLAAIDQLPASDHKSRGELYYVLADCYNYDEGQANLSKMARYMHAAAVEYPRLSSGIGDLYLCGWGVYQDFYLAASAYDIARLNGDINCYTSTRVVQYLLEHPVRNTRDSLAYDAFERFLYYQRISPDNSKALFALQSAADNGFVPAYCILGGITYDRAQRSTDPSQRDRLRQQAFELYHRGIQADYSPARVEMARLCMEWCVDTAKGLINTPDKQGRYPDKAVAKSYRQALSLLTYAAEHDNIKAMRILGDLYLNGGPQDIPAHDLDRAIRWYVDAARRANPIAREKLRHLSSMGLIASDRIPRYIRIAEEAALRESIYDQQLFQTIRHDPLHADYRLLPTSKPNEYSRLSSLGTTDDPILIYTINKSYHTLYGLYERILTELSERLYNGIPTLNDNGHYYQQRMRDIRDRHIKLLKSNIIDPIPTSVLESWTPNN